MFKVLRFFSGMFFYSASCANRKRATALFLIASCSSALAQAAPSVLSKIEEDQSSPTVSELGLRFGDSFLNTVSIPSNDPLFTWLGPASNSGAAPGRASNGTPNTTQDTTSRFFLGRASYHLAAAPEFFGTNVFENFAILKYLMGDNYSITQKQSPVARAFAFHGERQVSVAFFTTKIQSDTVLKVINWNQVTDPRLRQAVVELTGPTSPPPVGIVWQQISHFNKYIDRSFLLTLIYSDPRTGGTQMELYSASSLKDGDFALIPSWVQSSVIRSMADGDLVGYVKRLSQLK